MGVGPRGPNRRTKGWVWQKPHDHRPSRAVYNPLTMDIGRTVRRIEAAAVASRVYEPEAGHGLDEDQPIGGKR